ncbi:NINE protein [Roseovarius sp. EL26]|uniref:NINE protein n=1 Tax=Roseovarius sp. EL26 TaxID=2126672 RepID=UPI000EA27174|nr:NINE protein [Roseovarius sp. EL26]
MSEIAKSPKSYGVAVALCGIFGVIGIHHFYLKDYVHGLADLGLLVLCVVFAMNNNVGLFFLALGLDALHTIIVFYLLIVEKWRDGDGLPVLIK